MKKAVLLIAIAIGSICISNAQEDTIKVMYYNILKWEDSTDYNNLRIILQHSQPDIIALTEVQTRSIARDIFGCVSSSLPEHAYDTTDFYAISWANKGNMLYYNRDKFSLKFQDTILPVGHRYIDRYKLYYNKVNTDTVFLDVFIAHLTPSSGIVNEVSRYKEARAFQNYLTSETSCQNIMFGGDFNLYHGDEAAYRLLLDSGDCRMNDPVNTRGWWDNNADFSSVHTQSPGALDSRFDFILVSNDIMSVENKVKYISGTYAALGNDGAHFDQDITDPPLSASIPASLTNALREKSDHLPVVLKLLIEPPFPLPEEGTIEVLFENPVHDDMGVTLLTRSSNKLSIKAFNLLGQVVHSEEIENAETYNYLSISTINLRQGLYFLRVTDNENNRTVKKFFRP